MVHIANLMGARSRRIITKRSISGLSIAVVLPEVLCPWCRVSSAQVPRSARAPRPIAASPSKVVDG